VDRQERRLRELDADVDALREEVTAAIDAATTEALAGPMPTADDVLDGVFATKAEALGDGQAPWSGYVKAARSDA
jgi:TPP-dependent pyruvate/acetoin dehydrogenase alpha subunit